MRCKEIIQKIENSFPRGYALGFDNVGLLAGRTEKEVEKIFITLDVTDQALREAVNRKADMILSHHPLLFSPLKRVTDEDFIGRRLLTLIQQDISYYAMHTNYDVLRMADLAAGRLGLEKQEVLDATEERPKDASDSGTNEEKADSVPVGIGKIGEFTESMSLQDCCQLVKKAFDLDAVRVFGDLDEQVTKVAICPGSGKSVIQEAIQKGAQLLITGDIGHHEGIDAEAEGLYIIDAGHYGLEYVFMEDMKTFCAENLPGIQVETAGVCHPFQTI